MAKSVSRREVLLGSAAAPLVGQSRSRPNVLFIMVDEMRWDAMQCAGNPDVKTPNLDRLASQSVRFSNAYTVAPVCSPSRVSSFSGRYAHVHGVTTNSIAANEGEIFLPGILKHYGYHTAISGKLHYSPKRYGFGFDRFWSYTDEGPAPELGLSEYLRRKHGSPAKFPIVPGTCPWPDDPLGRDVGVFLHPNEDFETEWVTRQAVSYLQSRQNDPQPWFLFASYLKPHSPSVEPKRYMEMYDPASLTVPKLPADIKALRAAVTGRGKRKFVDDERMMRVMTSAYYGAITHIDEHVGKLLAELDRLGMTDNTAVLFTADHGNMLGDRGRWFKDVMYEGSSHVPLLWRDAKATRQGKPRVENRIVENIDLMPTILESAGVAAPDRIQGKSLRPLLAGQSVNWKDRCFAQLATAMVRTPEWKLIDTSRDLSGALELYNLRNDPKEAHNLASDKRHRDLIADLGRQLMAWRADRPRPVTIEGMSTPEYAQVDPRERSELLRNAPATRPEVPRRERSVN